MAEVPGPLGPSGRLEEASGSQLQIKLSSALAIAAVWGVNNQWMEDCVSPLCNKAFKKGDEVRVALPNQDSTCKVSKKLVEMHMTRKLYMDPRFSFT